MNFVLGLFGVGIAQNVQEFMRELRVAGVGFVDRELRQVIAQHVLGVDRVRAGSSNRSG